jgi:hypothetical protein
MSTDPVVMVPVDLEVEERLAGPVTFRMAGWLATTGAGAAALAVGRGRLWLFAAGGVLLPVGLAGAFVRPAGRPLAAWLVPLFGYRRRARAARQARRG